MAKTIQLTFPDAVAAALASKGAPLELTGAEFLKQYVLAAAFGEVGALRLADLVAAHSGGVALAAADDAALELFASVPREDSTPGA